MYYFELLRQCELILCIQINIWIKFTSLTTTSIRFVYTRNWCFLRDSHVKFLINQWQFAMMMLLCELRRQTDTNQPWSKWLSHTKYSKQIRSNRFLFGHNAKNDRQNKLIPPNLLKTLRRIRINLHIQWGKMSWYAAWEQGFFTSAIDLDTRIENRDKWDI